MFSMIMGQTLVKAAAVDFSIQWGVYAVSALLQTEKFYDLTGSSTFAFLAYKSLQWGNTYHTRQNVQTGMVYTWALRLGGFLFSRILKDGRDSRFDGVRDNPSKFFLYWTIQGVWIFVTLLPTLLLNAQAQDRDLCWRDWAGWGLWTSGFFMQAVADYQKSLFKSNPANKGMFISSGLWSLSRHPNYFGEICMWTGLYLSASAVLSGAQHVALVSPLFVTFLLTKVSGLPMLEAAARRKWGNNPDYLEYKARTPVLVPDPRDIWR